MSDQIETSSTPAVYDMAHLIGTMDAFLSRVIEHDSLREEAQHIRDLISFAPEQALMVELPEPTDSNTETALWRTQDTWVRARYWKGFILEIWVNNIRGPVRDTRGLALALLAATDRMA